MSIAEILIRTAAALLGVAFSAAVSYAGYLITVELLRNRYRGPRS